MSKDTQLKTLNDLKNACNDNKYILIIKRPQSKSRIHKGRCSSITFSHLFDFITIDRKLGMGKAKQRYFAFDTFEEVKNAYPTHVRPIDPYCRICIKESIFDIL